MDEYAPQKWLPHERPLLPGSPSTPLHTALKKEYLEAFKLLLRHGANPGVPGKDGRTVREIAARKKDRRYVSALPPDGVDAGP